MAIQIPIKGLIVFLVIFVIGFWFLESMGKNKDLISPLNSSLPQNLSNSVSEIEVTAQQFSFIPDSIRVKLGETVRLKIKSIDVTHGFALPEFEINEVLQPGKEIQVEFQATRKGSFQFFCSIACGIGHSKMRGTLIVE